MDVVLVTRSLLFGGTERQVVMLARGLKEAGHGVEILQLYAGCHFESELAEAGIQPFCLGVRRRMDLHRLLSRGLPRVRRRRGSVIVHGFHVESNLFSLAAGRATPGARVIWGLRVSDPEVLARDRPARVAARLHRRLARRADLVIANSGAGRRYALAADVSPERALVIANGIDTGHFRPDSAGRERLRSTWAISGSDVLVGTIGRIEPHKGHELFLRAAAAFVRQDPRARFVCVGDGEPAERARLAGLARELGIEDVVHWAGVRKDMPAVYSALDVSTLLSPLGEGSPNAVIEAVACGVPCVVGGSWDPAGGPAQVVVALDPDAVAAGWRRALAAATPGALMTARALIEREYGVARMVERTEGALLALA